MRRCVLPLLLLAACGGRSSPAADAGPDSAPPDTARLPMPACCPWPWTSPWQTARCLIPPCRPAPARLPSRSSSYPSPPQPSTSTVGFSATARPKTPPPRRCTHSTHQDRSLSRWWVSAAPRPWCPRRGPDLSSCWPTAWVSRARPTSNALRIFPVSARPPTRAPPGPRVACAPPCASRMVAQGGECARTWRRQPRLPSWASLGKPKSAYLPAFLMQTAPLGYAAVPCPAGPTAHSRSTAVLRTYRPT